MDSLVGNWVDNWVGTVVEVCFGSIVVELQEVACAEQTEEALHIEGVHVTPVVEARQLTFERVLAGLSWCE